ncbi:hypothetical protein [Candidatus Albibeggiatoa sp. nov. NOAA]|uniref:hypothetical protein n=1 Tax=Candidatus Albibeggiatoa sp. nov. NOAA TaxID=3162724 RepID=UPI0032FA6CF1|nr:hypothetical protein [Thiotrichaceae bacterium]
MRAKEIGDMPPEYDFSNRKGIRGKYHQAYIQGHQVNIHKDDGSVETHYFTLEEGAVMLAPDVAAYFKNSDAVNNALRKLIAQKQTSI